MKLAEVNISASFVLAPVDTIGTVTMGKFASFCIDFVVWKFALSHTLTLLQQVEYQQVRLIYIVDNLILNLSLRRTWNRIQDLFLLVEQE